MRSIAMNQDRLHRLIQANDVIESYGKLLVECLQDMTYRTALADDARLLCYLWIAVHVPQHELCLSMGLICGGDRHLQ